MGVKAKKRKSSEWMIVDGRWKIDERISRLADEQPMKEEREKISFIFLLSSFSLRFFVARVT
jgi:hypothetical protein